MAKRICIDFDGVLHDYSKGWQGEDVFNKPMDGAKDFVDRLKKEGWEVCILTSRTPSDKLKQFFTDNEIPYDMITSEKVPAKVYLDDRGLRFNGDFNEAYESIINFKVWYSL